MDKYEFEITVEKHLYDDNFYCVQVWLNQKPYLCKRDVHIDKVEMTKLLLMRSALSHQIEALSHQMNELLHQHTSL